MTEDEAKTKWCPWARVRGGESRFSSYREGIGHISLPHSGTHCLGSGCMAWRWSELESRTGHCGNAGATNGHGP